MEQWVLHRVSPVSYGMVSRPGEPCSYRMVSGSGEPCSYGMVSPVYTGMAEEQKGKGLN